MVNKTYHEFIVRVPRVEGVPAQRWQDYISDAVRSWGGQLPPVYGAPGAEQGDPLGPPCEWNQRVVVTLQRRRK